MDTCIARKDTKKPAGADHFCRLYHQHHCLLCAAHVLCGAQIPDADKAIPQLDDALDNVGW